jgi:acetyl/propionyl-CoA carboxylase alpha subunit
VRFDSHLYLGMPVTTHYDSLIAKVIAWGEDRPRALRRLHRALDELQVGGVPTTLSFLAQIVSSHSFVSGRTDTTYLDHFQPAPPDPGDALEIEAALAAALVADQEAQKKNRQAPAAETSMWRLAAWKEQMRG